MTAEADEDGARLGEIAQLRREARAIFTAGVAAASPAEAVRRSLRLLPGGGILIGGTRIGGQEAQSHGRLRIVAVGKAALAMMGAALEVVPRDLVVAPCPVVTHEVPCAASAGEDASTESSREDASAMRARATAFLDRAAVITAGHPLPDARGLQASLRVESYVAGARPGAGLLVLLSGGGSALLVAPAPGISLEDKIVTTRLLLGCGAGIREVNTVRKHLSRLKGGQLAALAQPAAVEALIVSDVVGDDLSSIASGPTAPDPTTFGEALEILTRRRILEKVPAEVRRHLETGARGGIRGVGAISRSGEIDGIPAIAEKPLADAPLGNGRFGETPKPGDPIFERVSNRIVASGAQSLDAAATRARALGYEVHIVSRALVGEAREAARVLVAEAARVIGEAGSGCALSVNADSASPVSVEAGSALPMSVEAGSALPVSAEARPESGVSVGANAASTEAGLTLRGRTGTAGGRLVALLAAGETTVTVRGRGLGGRNQELALAFALEAERAGLRDHWAFLSAGTDGRDGPTDAAGAVVDPGTLGRGRRVPGTADESYAPGRSAVRLSAERALEENDSYHFLERAGDLLVTGPTGTNVADLQVLLMNRGR